MSKSLVVAALLGAASVFAFGSALAGGDPAAGKKKAAACASCHGADGNSVNPAWPKLASQHAKYLVKQLEDFKAGRRKNSLMAPMAASLSAQDREDVAAYFSSQPIQPGTADPKRVKLGEKIWRAGNKQTGVPACMGCHAPNGVGNPLANFPRLAGQHAKYVENQLRAFRSGARSNDANKMMRAIAAKMTDEEIQAVASFVQGLRP
ncbi:MAG: cytochrome c4 [Gammaproteobacteria bacterium]|nr:MAG: cytochrome c4 [Gammaproteobacteria bacterium]